MRQNCTGAILLYHRIAEAKADPYGLCTTPLCFEQQMRFVRDRCHVLPLEDLVLGAATNSLDARSVAITFDDGYLDNLHTASVILAREGLSATFFLCTANLNQPAPFWWDVIAEAGLADAQDLRNRLMALDVGARSDLLSDVVSGLVDTGALPRPMSSIEICRLAAVDGVSIGAHTTNHLYLPAQREHICLRELLESKTALETLLQRPIHAVAYPFGGFTDCVKHAAMGVGFKTGVTTRLGAVDCSSDPLALPRIEVRPETNVEQVLETLFVVEPGRATLNGPC